MTFRELQAIRDADMRQTARAERDTYLDRKAAERARTIDRKRARRDKRATVQGMK